MFTHSHIAIAKRSIALAAMIATLAACGQRGPLYLPTESGKAPPPSVPAPIKPAGDNSQNASSNDMKL